MSAKKIQEIAARAKANALERARQLGPAAALGDRQAGHALQVELGALGLNLCFSKVEADASGTVRAHMSIPPEVASDDVDEYLATLTTKGNWSLQFENDVQR